MKTLLLIVFLPGVHAVYGQLKIDPDVKKQFDSLFRIQPMDIQQKRYVKGPDSGLALLIDFKEDTLNIADFKPFILDSSIKIVSVDENGNELPEPPRDTTNYNQWMPCFSSIVGDTLMTGTFFGLFSGVGWSLKIINSKIDGEYFEYKDNDSVFRHALTDIKRDDIHLRLRIEALILSNIPNKFGDIFYGKAIMETESFYEDNDEFKNGYLQKRYQITYLFTTKVIKPDE